MDEDQLLTAIGSEGWFVSSDEVGDKYCLNEVDGVIIQLLPHIGKRTDHYRLGLSPSVSTKEFSEAVPYIAAAHSEFSPIISSNLPPTKLINVTPGDVRDLLVQAVSWAKSQDIDSGLKKYRDLPTDSKGAFPLRHLAALAIAGDASRLNDYVNSFLQGDRLGFVNYITKEFIDRACEIAKSKSQRS